MSALRSTIQHDDRPAVELQNTSAGILVTTFGWPRTLSSDEAERLYLALGEMIAARGGRVNALPNIPKGHQELAEFASASIRDASALLREGR